MCLLLLVSKESDRSLLTRQINADRQKLRRFALQLLAADYLRRYVLKRIDEASESNSKNVERVDRNGLTRKLHSRLAG